MESAASTITHTQALSQLRNTQLTTSCTALYISRAPQTNITHLKYHGLHQTSNIKHQLPIEHHALRTPTHFGSTHTTLKLQALWFNKHFGSTQQSTHLQNQQVTHEQMEATRPDAQWTLYATERQCRCSVVALRLSDAISSSFPAFAIAMDL
jgi:hypothetical protein